MLPTDEQALQFVILLRAGIPASHAILFFLDSDDPAEIAHTLRKWQRSRAVGQAMLKLAGKAWQNMTTEEMMKEGIDLHYRQLAHLLHSENYIEADAPTKAKMDAARTAIEAKLAGTAGKMDAMTQFIADFHAKKKAEQAGRFN